MENPMKSGRVALLVVAWASVAAILAGVFPLFATDSACRYAPMAEAFAEGDWAEAFHPRFGVGMPVVAGLIHLVVRCDGYSACAAASTFAWALGVWPVFRLGVRVFDVRTAWFAVVLYLLCPQPLVWALKGLRESFKLLGVLMMADALFSARTETRRWYPAAVAAAALWLLFTFKCDAILPGGILALVFMFVDGFRWRSAAVGLAGALALQPMCALVFSWTGYWLPAPHYVPLWQKVFGA